MKIVLSFNPLVFLKSFFCDVKSCMQKRRDSHDRNYFLFYYFWASGRHICLPLLIGTTLPTSSVKWKLTNAHIAAFAIYFICACDFRLKFPLAMTLKAGNLRINSQSQFFITSGKGSITGGQNNFGALQENLWDILHVVISCTFFLFFSSFFL